MTGLQTALQNPTAFNRSTDVTTAVAGVSSRNIVSELPKAAV